MTFCSLYNVKKDLGSKILNKVSFFNLLRVDPNKVICLGCSCTLEKKVLYIYIYYIHVYIGKISDSIESITST